MPDTRMTKTEREAFLAAPRIGVVSIGRANQPPLSAPVWYEYTPGGDLWFLTGPVSAKGKLLGLQTPVTLVAQSEELPYAYVSVCLLYTSPSPRDRQKSRMPSSA